MTNTAQSIVNQALGLNSRERAHLAEKLLSSLDVTNPKIDANWAKESDARIEAYERGEIETVSIHEVFKKYQK